MPRKKLTILPERVNWHENCYAFHIDKTGAPACRALTDVYCLKERTPCPFRATPGVAAAARRRSSNRLAHIGLR